MTDADKTDFDLTRAYRAARYAVARNAPREWREDCVQDTVLAMWRLWPRKCNVHICALNASAKYRSKRTIYTDDLDAVAPNDWRVIYMVIDLDRIGLSGGQRTAIHDRLCGRKIGLDGRNRITCAKDLVRRALTKRAIRENFERK